VNAMTVRAPILLVAMPSDYLPKISIDASDLLFYYRANTGKEVIEKI
jgi:hypothetical protein